MGEIPKLKQGITLGNAIKALSAANITTAHVGIFDLMGTFRERRLAIGDVASVMDGGGTFVNVLPQWDAGEQVFGSGPFVGEAVTVDPESIRPYPFEDNACLMVADYTGPSAVLSPRQLLQRQIEKADALGFGIRAAFESEFMFSMKMPRHYAKTVSCLSKHSPRITAAGRARARQPMPGL